MGSDHESSRYNDRYSARRREEDDFWDRRRAKRERYGSKGVRDVWASSPSHRTLQLIYEEHEEAQKRNERELEEMEKREAKRMKESKSERKRRRRSSSSSSSPVASKKDKKKKRKKEKKRKSKHKKRRSSVSSDKSSASDSDNDISIIPPIQQEKWVEMTKELREEEDRRTREEEAQMVGPAIPSYLLPKTVGTYVEPKFDAEQAKNMLRGEAMAMAAYAAQGKRIPRRGEIGLASDEIETFERAGYVMSGTRHKSMEATRLRKENQILTAEEKRLLSGFSQEQRKEKEDLVMQQFQNLISSKRSHQ